MRKITKGPKPKVLRANSQLWTKRALAYQAAKKKIPIQLRYAYRHPEIKKALVQESFQKCAYCESYVTHVVPGDVDHITPVSLTLRQLFQWSNLILACPTCNRLKSNSVGLINPIKDDPSKYLQAWGTTIWYQKGMKGRMTVELLELNRSELIERRNDRIEEILKMFDELERTSGLVKQRFLLRQILKQSTESNEFSFVVAQLIADKLAKSGVLKKLRQSIGKL